MPKFFLYILQNTVCLEQKMYSSPVNFKQALLVMLKTFRKFEF